MYHIFLLSYKYADTLLSRAKLNNKKNPFWTGKGVLIAEWSYFRVVLTADFNCITRAVSKYILFQNLYIDAITINVKVIQGNR